MDEQKDFLYHYTSIDALEKIIQTKYFFLGSSKTMDDATEITYGLSCIKDFFEKNESEVSKSIRAVLSNEEINKSIDAVLSIPFYIVSFGDRPSIKNLWEQYATYGRGVCIELDRKAFENEMNLVFNQLDPESFTNIPFPEFGEVHYSDIENFIEGTLTVLKERDLDSIVEPLSDYTKQLYSIFVEYAASRICGFIKNAERWKQQGEFRLLFKYNPVKKTSFPLVNVYQVIREYEGKIESDILNNLGLDTEKAESTTLKEKNRKKIHLEFCLERIDCSKIVKRVFVSNDFPDNKTLVERTLKENGINSISVEIARKNDN